MRFVLILGTMEGKCWQRWQASSWWNSCGTVATALCDISVAPEPRKQYVRDLRVGLCDKQYVHGQYEQYGQYELEQYGQYYGAIVQPFNFINRDSLT